MIRALHLTILALLLQDWPSLRGPNQNGAVELEEPLPNQFQFVENWSRHLGSAYSEIVIQDDHAVTVYSDGEQDWLIALDVETGDELWQCLIGETFPGKYGAEDGPTSTPCLADGCVFAVGPNGEFLSVDLETGERLWSVDLVDRHQAQVPTYGIGGSPVYLDSSVYVPIRTSEGLSGLAFDPGDGTLLWAYSGNYVDYHPSLITKEGLLVCDAFDLALLNPDDGEVLCRWVHHRGRRDYVFPQMAPVSDDQLLLTYDDDCALFQYREKPTPRLIELWRSRDFNNSYAPPIIVGQEVYGMSGTFLVCLDLETGRRHWKSREPGARGITRVGDSFFFLAADGYLVGATATREGYQEQARLKVANRGGYTPPVFANGRLFARNTESIACATIVEGKQATTKPILADTFPPGAFGTFLRTTLESSSPQSAIDAWWNDLDGTPLIENDSVVHFVFRGTHRDVAIIGDMTKDRHIPETMHRLPGTDLFYRTYEYDREGVWQYRFLVDAERVLRDPQNPRTAMNIAQIPRNPPSVDFSTEGEESLLIMPGFPRAAVELHKPPPRTGRLEQVSLRRTDGLARPTSVYLPASYSEGNRKYPTLYIPGGDLWLTDGNLKDTCDRVMGTLCEEAIVVLLPYHVGSGDRLGGDEYARMILNEVVESIDDRFRTTKQAVALGVADDATAVVPLALRSPERFSRIAVLSGRFDPEDFALLDGFDHGPTIAHVEWSRYEPRIADENLDYVASNERLRQRLVDTGCSVTGGEVVPGPGWTLWKSKLAQMLERLLPLE